MLERKDGIDTGGCSGLSLAIVTNFLKEGKKVIVANYAENGVEVGW